MAIGIGGLSSPKITVPSSINIAAAATTVSAVVPTGFAGYLDLQNTVGVVTTALANLESNETLSLQYTASGGSAVTVASMAVGAEISATAAVGTLAAFIIALGYENGINLSAGDALQIVVANPDVTGDAGVLNVLLPIVLRRI